MRIRLPFLGAFFSLLLLAGYAGLSTLQVSHVNDKLLHFMTFFLLTLVFYWILDTSRRRNLHLTLVVCTGILGIGSEFLQGLIPDNGRNFDVNDIVANIFGSLTAVGGCYWYHKRMLDRKRSKRGYGLVAGDEVGDDVELGEGSGLAGLDVDGQESGITVPDHVAPVTTPVGEPVKNLERELDAWDENEADEWDEDDHVTSGDGEGGKTPSASSAGGDIGEREAPVKKRMD